jgi:hypothetical protein
MQVCAKDTCAGFAANIKDCPNSFIRGNEDRALISYLQDKGCYLGSESAVPGTVSDSKSANPFTSDNVISVEITRKATAKEVRYTVNACRQDNIDCIAVSKISVSKETGSVSVTETKNIDSASSPMAKALAKNSASAFTGNPKLSVETNYFYNKGNFAKVTKLIHNKIGEAHLAEPPVTKNLVDSVSNASSDAHMAGLDFRFKGAGSLRRKIVEKSQEHGISEEAYTKQITDALRYTVCSSEKNLVNDFFAVKSYLSDHGIKMIECTNTYGSKNVSYKGINTLCVSNGYTFELQFHTEIGFWTKENKTHPLYEKKRRKSTSEEEKAALERQMCEITSHIPVPDNIDKIKNFK